MDQWDSSEEIAAFIQAFEACTLPKPRWTHQAHLVVGLWYVLHYGKEEAAPLVRNGIRRYNEAVGTPNTDDSGYHETITIFYIWFIDRFLTHTDRQRPLAEIVYELLAKHSDRNLPLQYYSRERLMSVAARREWLEPDLLPLLS